MTFADYLLRANVCLAGLFGLYYLLFRRHTFFALNRAYLLLTLLAAALLPLIELPTETVEAANMPTVYLPMVATAAPETPDFSLTDALWWGYGMGVALYAGWLLLGLWRVARLIASGERVARCGYTLVVVENSRLSPFSFFKYLVISRSDYNQHHQTVPYDPSDGPIDNPIFRHELVHIQQWHSADVLLAEVVKCLCWCNPVAWWLPRALQQTHEFLADQAATDARLTRADYARFLVSYALGAKPDEARTLLITNSFAEFSQLKTRIIMLKTNPTNRRAIWLYALALPILAILTSLVADRYPMATLPQTNVSQKLVTVSGIVTDEKKQGLPGANIVLVDGTKGTTTDSKGYFKLENVPARVSLAVSFVGFESYICRAGDKETVFVVRLKQRPTTLSEIFVAVGYPASDDESKNTAPSRPNSFTGNDEIFTVVEQQPEFPGGMSELGRFISKTIRYPAEAVKNRTEGRVFVQFIVSKTGEVQNSRILKGIGNGCDEEALRVMAEMPNWLPGKQNGRPVAVQYNLPIQFSMEQTKKQSSVEVSPKVPSLSNRDITFVLNDTISLVRMLGANSFEVGKEPLYILDGGELKEGQKYKQYRF